MKFKLPKGYIGNVIIQESVLNIAIDELTSEELRIYLKLCILCTNKTEKDMSELVSYFKLENSDVLYQILSVLEKKKFIKISASGISLIFQNSDNPVVKRFKTNLNNDMLVMNEMDIVSIIRTAEKSFGKMLSVAEINSLTNLNNWYGLSNDVILILIEYMSSVGKKSISQIERMALRWSELEIDTPAKAHEYIRLEEEKNTSYGKMKTLLKIYNRDLTKKEKEFVDSWNRNFSEEQIFEAYEKTIDITGKVSFAYMDKILNSDGSVPARKNTVRKRANKFTNFSQREDNYSDIEKRMFEKMIKEAEKK